MRGLKNIIKDMLYEKQDKRHKLMDFIALGAFAAGIVLFLVSIVGVDVNYNLIIAFFVLVAGASLWAVNKKREQTEKAEMRREKVERLILQMMLTLANTIDAKDKYTNGHSVRVAEYAREIARRAGKSEEEQEFIYFTGLLHDIGKIGIPNAIINKSSGLTEEEYEIVKTHPRIGADILESMTEIPGLADGAHWHHELYDGNGYPDRLKGEQIPEMARIIGVADAYDAMASRRSYRDTLPQKEVRVEIENGKGIQFDPYFAQIMLEMIDEDTEYLMCER